MKIVTYGSCLSRFITEALQRAGYDAQRVGSIYHNRIDIFTDTVLSKTRPYALWNILDQLKYKSPEAQKENMIILRNQLPRENNGMLGYWLISESDPGFFEGIKSADVILTDNFIDVVAQALQSHSGPERMFFNSKSATNTEELFKGIGYLTPEIGTKRWGLFFDWIRQQNSSAKLVFTNFPTRHHSNVRLRHRSDEWANLMPKRKDVYYLPVVDIRKDQLISGTQSHFTNDVYDEYVKKLMPYLDV